MATAVVLVALYYLLPLDHIRNVPLMLAGGLLILAVVNAWQLRAIVRAKEPAMGGVMKRARRSFESFAALAKAGAAPGQPDG